MMREDRKRAEQRQKKIARRKREVQRMKRKLYKAGILAAAGIIVLAVILMLCGSGNTPLRGEQQATILWLAEM